MLFLFHPIRFFLRKKKTQNLSDISKSANKAFVYPILSTFYRLAILCGLSCFSAIHAESRLSIEVSAKAAVLLNAETGAVLYEKNAHQPMYPASITKISTALYALEKKGYALDEPVMASADAVSAVHPHVKRANNSRHPPYRLEFGGSHMGIKIGEVLSFKTLLYGLMLSSGNDAANVIAENVSGSVGQFMKELNAFVRSKGCANTVLYAPHGLPHDDHKTTAYDMALLAKDALKIPLFREIVKTVSCTRPATNMQPESLLHQHNALVKPGAKFYYPKAIGIKTGYTSAAGYTIIAAAEDSERKLIAVLLGCEKLDQRYRDAIALFEMAFNEKKSSRTLFSRDFDFFSTQMHGGKNLLQAGLLNDLIVEYYPSDGQVMHSKVFWEDKPLPIRKNEKVGEVRIFSDHGQIVASALLFAISDVDPTFKHLLQLKYKAVKQVLNNHHSYVLALLGCALLGIAFALHGRRKKTK
jgi:D-alanyl-D-alanine carboxypeptidase (penicillin-binding protein 5/6)